MEDKELGVGVNVLVSILLYYPQIIKVNYDPGSKSISFGFMINRIVEENEFALYKDSMIKYLDAYSTLTENRRTIINMNTITCDKSTFIEVERDVETMTMQEISLITTILNDEFNDAVVIDTDDCDNNKKSIGETEELDHMLTDFKNTLYKRNLIGYRNQGRVLVFNKPVELN